METLILSLGPVVGLCGGALAVRELCRQGRRRTERRTLETYLEAYLAGAPTLPVDYSA